MAAEFGAKIGAMTATHVDASGVTSMCLSVKHLNSRIRWSGLSFVISATVVLLQGQTQPAVFDVSSIKPNRLAPRQLRVSISCSAGGFRAEGYTLYGIVKWLYRTDRFDPIGLPGWAGNDGERYDIVGKATASPLTQEDCLSMVRGLLA